jgi:hypothetical protein
LICRILINDIVLLVFVIVNERGLLHGKDSNSMRIPIQ